MDKAKQEDVSKLSFEDAIKELGRIVEGIEKGQMSLQSGIQQYEKGMELIKHCRQILQKAEKRIEKINAEGHEENSAEKQESK